MIEELFSTYAKKAKLPSDKSHPHTLKHSIVVHMLDAGHSQEEAKYESRFGWNNLVADESLFFIFVLASYSLMSLRRKPI